MNILCLLHTLYVHMSITYFISTHVYLILYMYIYLLHNLCVHIYVYMYMYVYL